MTMQMQDTIYYRGSSYVLGSEPLETYDKLPKFSPLMSSNHRGYTAVWAIIQDRLFIVSLSGWSDGEENIGLEVAFPECSGPVFADWYSGELSLQSGRVVANLEIFPLYERVDILTVKNGRVTGIRTYKREWSPDNDLDGMFFIKIETLDELASETLDKLKKVNINYFGDLIQLEGLELFRKANLKLEEVDLIVDIVASCGCLLGTRVPGWPPKTYDLKVLYQERNERLRATQV